jgi:hypothetical protein
MGSIYRRKDSPNWYYYYFERGKKVTRKGTRNKKTTEMLLNEAEQEARLREAGLKPDLDNNVEADSLFSKYLEYGKKLKATLLLLVLSET